MNVIDGTKERAIYFGCWGEKGHHFWRPHRMSGRAWESVISAWLGNNRGPGGNMDLLPGRRDPWAPDTYPPPRGEQVQGLWRVTLWRHPADGSPMTVMACWDRTVDGRDGCNSSFFIFDEDNPIRAEQTARSLFPEIWARLDAAGTPQSRRAPYEAALLARGASPHLLAALGEPLLVELAGLVAGGGP